MKIEVKITEWVSYLIADDGKWLLISRSKVSQAKALKNLYRQCTSRLHGMDLFPKVTDNLKDYKDELKKFINTMPELDDDETKKRIVFEKEI